MIRRKKAFIYICISQKRRSSLMVIESTYVNDIKKNKEVFLQGWVHDIRELPTASFILLRDITGIVQCVLKQDSKGFNEKLTLESVISVKGKVKDAKLTSEEL